MAELFKDFKIKQIYDNGQSANTAMYRNYLKNIKAKNIAYKTLKKGDTFTWVMTSPLPSCRRARLSLKKIPRAFLKAA